MHLSTMFFTAIWFLFLIRLDWPISLCSFLFIPTVTAFTKKIESEFTNLRRWRQINQSMTNLHNKWKRTMIHSTIRKCFFIASFSVNEVIKFEVFSGSQHSTRRVFSSTPCRTKKDFHRGQNEAYLPSCFDVKCWWGVQEWHCESCCRTGRQADFKL